MDQSDSQRSMSRLSLSLSWPSRLAPVVGAAGVGWASQVPSNAFGTCHALRPRQVSGILTISASSVLGSADATASPPACFSVVSRLDCFSEVRLSLAACACPCVRFQEFVQLLSLLVEGFGLSWLPATLGLGWSVRPSHPVSLVLGHRSCFRVVVHVQSGGIFTLDVAQLPLWRTAS
jgi:hypothetical protein